jgi:hypothetical protein
MSDPVLSENAEDVLASIRRLVSGEEAGETRQTRAAAGPEPLLLTPEQRVDPAAGQGARRDAAATEGSAPYRLTQRIDAETAEDPAADETLDWHDSDASEGRDRDMRGAESPGSHDLTAESRALDRVEERALVDDAALRELVAEIVREELTGEFGDRITRNVRKLVRREINRVLSGRNGD